MTMQTIKGGLWIPGTQLYFSALPALTNAVTLNDSNDAMGWVFQIPKNGNIHSIGFRTGTVTTGDTVKVGIYTVDTATGLPTASAYKGMVDGTQVIADANDNTWFTVNLGTDATSVVAGDDVAIVIQFNSFVAGNLQIITSFTNTGTMGFTYGVFFETAWNQQAIGTAVFYVKYSDGTVAYIPETFPVTTITNQAFNSTSGADQYALKFQLPFPARVNGVSLIIGVSGDFQLILYDSDGTTPLATITHDKDIINSTGVTHYAARFPTPATIAKLTNYYLAVKPTTSSNVNIVLLTVPEAAALDQMEGGQNFILSTKDGANPWSDVSTQIPVISMLLDQFDDGTAVGGGLLTHPGMAGGMRA